MKVIDLHCDTISRLEKAGPGYALARNPFHIDLEKLRKGDYLLQTFALFVNRGEHEDAFGWCRRLLSRFQEEMEANQESIGQIRTYSQLQENRARNRMSALLSIEEGEVCEGSIKRLGEFYEAGVRMMTLTWNYPNSLASPNHIPGYEKGCGVMRADTEDGLTDTGIEFVEEMERLSMMIDVSHLGDRGIFDVLAHTKGPILASHSNARSLCGHVRNLTDEMIRKIASRGGIIGVNFYPPFLEEAAPGACVKGTVDRIIDHIEYLRQTGGGDCVSLGTDFDGMEGELEIRDASCMQLLAEGMIRRGYCQTQIEKVFYRNAEAFLKEMLP